MKLPPQNLRHFSSILVVPDSFCKIHVRYLINMIFNLGFKSVFIHQESVMATYAMALPTAVVVDIGSTKTSVCCIEEGIIIQKSVIRKNFGGEEQNDLLLRLIQSEKALHYFPSGLLNPEYKYHRYLLEDIKETFGTMEMSPSDIVQTCQIFIKDKDSKKNTKSVNQVTFNSSDALLFCCQSLFYTQLI